MIIRESYSQGVLGPTVARKAGLAHLQNEIMRQASSKDVSISIGRGKFAMSETEWDRFKAGLMEVVDTGEADFHFIGTGKGIYKGKQEESFTILFSTTNKHIEDIKKALVQIKEVFGQEHIAVTIGRTELV